MDSKLEYASMLDELADYTESHAIGGMQQLSDYDEIMEVLTAHKSFVQGAYATGRELIEGTLTLLDGDDHLQRRRLLGVLMSDEALTQYHEESLRPSIESALQELMQESRDDDGVVRTDLVSLSQRCVHRIAAALTGIDEISDRAAEDRFIEYVQKMGAGIAADWSRDDPTSVVAAGVKALEGFRDEFFTPSVRRRREAIAAGDALPVDLITLMYSDWNEAWDPGLPLREAAALMVGATQTTALSLVLLVLRLHDWFEQHPEDRDRLRSDPEFLRSATHESLRMTVPAPARVRLAVEDVTLRSGREISRGERVALLFLPANLDEARFGADADRYKPSRCPVRAAPWGLTFGAGRHVCLGRVLATGSGDTDGAIATLARRLYDAGLELDGTPIPDETTHYPGYRSVPVRLTNL